NGDEQSQAESVTKLITTLGERFAFLVFDLGGMAEPWVRAASDVSDVVVEVVEAPGRVSTRAAPARRRIFEVVNLHNGASHALPINHCEPFVIPDDPALRDLEPVARAEHVRANRRSPASPPLHRLARKILAQLAFPCRAVAADIETGERVSIGTGALDVAFRASSAVPMLWAPVRLDGRVLVDGGVVDPVPAEVVREMGADLCIAVNVVPQLKKGVDTVLSRLYRGVNQFNPLVYLIVASG